MKFDSFARYGVELKRLSENELEMLRAWRNDPRVSVFMAQQNGKTISKDEQIAWFESIKNKSDAFYYIAYFRGEPVGYNAIKNINWSEGFGEPGNISASQNPFVTLFRTMCAFDLFFEQMGLSTLNAHFNDKNSRILKFSSLFGYEYEGIAGGGIASIS